MVIYDKKVKNCFKVFIGYIKNDLILGLLLCLIIVFDSYMLLYVWEVFEFFEKVEKIFFIF